MNDNHMKIIIAEFDKLRNELKAIKQQLQTMQVELLLEKMNEAEKINKPSL